MFYYSIKLYNFIHMDTNKLTLLHFMRFNGVNWNVIKHCNLAVIPDHLGHPPFLAEPQDDSLHPQVLLSALPCLDPALHSFLLLLIGPATIGAHQPLVGWCVPSLGPYGLYLCQGCPKLLCSDLISTRYPPKHFRCPNTIVIYINLYLSIISRLLVISVISSGTPNNIRSPNHITHIIQIVIER